jgi:hypothetical protein
MKKIKKISSNNIKNIVKEHFLEDSLLPEHKIDNIIKEYLSEREDFLDDEESLSDGYELSPKSREAILDMVDGLSEMIDDLDIISEKEGNVLLNGGEEYTDDILEEVLVDLEEALNKLKRLTGDDLEEPNTEEIDF